jgi:hypothetical protein
MSTLEAGELLAASVATTPNRVSLDHLHRCIVGEEYLNPVGTPHLTLAVLTCRNGWALVGVNAPADPANFDAAAGRTFAKDDAIRQLWALEGYLLRERLAWADTVAASIREAKGAPLATLTEELEARTHSAEAPASVRFAGSIPVRAHFASEGAAE